jgi:hypothetical protein
MDPSEPPSSEPEAHAFEALLQSQPLRPVPQELRDTILSRHAQERRPAERRPIPSVWEHWWTRMSSPVTGLAAIWILAWIGFQLDTWILGSPIPSAAVPSSQALQEAREERLALLRALESQNHQTEPEPRSPAHLQPRSHLRQRLRPGQAQGLPSVKLAWAGGDQPPFDRDVQASSPVYEMGSLTAHDSVPIPEYPLPLLNV